MGKRVELLPCPFCGGEARLLEPVRVESDWWCASVMCLGTKERQCVVQMTHGAVTKRDAVRAVVEAWNRRDD